MVYFIILTVAAVIVSMFLPKFASTTRCIAILLCLVGFLASTIIWRLTSVNVYSDPIYVYKNDQGLIVEVPEGYKQYDEGSVDGHLVYKLQVGVCRSFWTYKTIPIYKVRREYLVRWTTRKSIVKKLLQDAPNPIKDLN